MQILASSPLLTLFLVIALGTLFGSIPFGPLKFGAAGALFVGLAAGALDPALGENLSLVSAIGLALFVYTIGLAAGASFFRDLRKQAPLLIGAVALLALYALIVAFGGKALGLNSPLLGGMFAGSLTTTPALAAATDAARKRPAGSRIRDRLPGGGNRHHGGSNGTHAGKTSSEKRSRSRFRCGASYPNYSSRKPQAHPGNPGDCRGRGVFGRRAADFLSATGRQNAGGSPRWGTKRR